MRLSRRRVVRINREELRELMGAARLELPKYVEPLINMANRFSQGTRPRVVGQVSELIRECPERNYEDWKHWYLERYPRAIEEATGRIINVLGRMGKAMEGLNKELVRAWVEDVVLVRTFIGFRIQEPILRKVADALGREYRLATPLEESRGIDGYIGDNSVSVKPSSYRARGNLRREIGARKIIYYEIQRDGSIIVDSSPLLT